MTRGWAHCHSIFIVEWTTPLNVKKLPGYGHNILYHYFEIHIRKKVYSFLVEFSINPTVWFVEGKSILYDFRSNMMQIKVLILLYSYKKIYVVIYKPSQWKFYDRYDKCSILVPALLKGQSSKNNNNKRMNEKQKWECLFMSYCYPRDCENIHNRSKYTFSSVISLQSFTEIFFSLWLVWWTLHYVSRDNKQKELRLPLPRWSNNTITAHTQREQFGWSLGAIYSYSLWIWVRKRFCF